MRGFQYYMGLRFRDLEIPKGSLVLSAKAPRGGGEVRGTLEAQGPGDSVSGDTPRCLNNVCTVEILLRHLANRWDAVLLTVNVEAVLLTHR